jgi:hypothetical protein
LYAKQVFKIILLAMLELQSYHFEDNYQDNVMHILVKEKDMDDSIVYDVFSDDNYLMTVSVEGKIIFSNEAGKNLGKPRTDQILERMKTVIKI